MKVWIIGLTFFAVSVCGFFLLAFNSVGSAVLTVILVAYVISLAKYHWHTHIAQCNVKSVLGLSHIDDDWQLMNAQGLWQRFEFQGYSALGTFCLMLHFVDQDAKFWQRKRAVVLMNDSAEPNDLRRLRVFLKFYRPKGVVAEGLDQTV
ncbi:MAG: hypothetical protein COB04_03205 [Gammaproteobacteria bacterium]|nr:MAG: hypothetical protein COB04_03205 [Gammaproteobacteria bacterium]